MVSKRRPPGREKGVIQPLRSRSADVGSAVELRAQAQEVPRVPADAGAPVGQGGRRREGAAWRLIRGPGALGRSSSTPASSNASRMAQMRKAMSSGSAAASPSAAPGRALGSTGKAARWGGAGPRPRQGEASGAARRGAANRSTVLPPPAPRPGRRAPRARSLG